MIKRISMMVIIVLMLLQTTAYGVTKVEKDIQIVLNGITIIDKARIQDGDAYLPLKPIALLLGYDVQESAKDNTICLCKAGEKVLIDLNRYIITANDHTYYLTDEYLNDEADGTGIDSVYMKSDFFYDYLNLKMQWYKENQKIILKSIKKNPITVKTINQTYEDSIIKITLQYPQLYGLEDNAVQNNINSVFEREAMAAKEQGLKNADEIKNIITYPNTDIKIECETYFDYKIKYNQNGLISVVFTDYQYSGGAHGITLQKSYTFNIKTGEEYKLCDLMKSGADYVSNISNNIRGKIDEKVKAGILAEIGDVTFNTIKSDQDYYLSGDSVTIYFQQYEYFPYAAGIQKFSIPFSTLKNMLRPDLYFLYN